MTVPIWVLLAFSLWTLVVLLATVGVYRWRRIFNGTVAIRQFRFDNVASHSDRYRRAMRAHANCVENLPVYGAMVLVLEHIELDTAALDISALWLLGARVGQTLVHVGLTETNITVSVRFCFFFTQLLAMLWMVLVIVRSVTS